MEKPIFEDWKKNEFVWIFQFVVLANVSLQTHKKLYLLYTFLFWCQLKSASSWGIFLLSWRPWWASAFFCSLCWVVVSSNIRFIYASLLQIIGTINQNNNKWSKLSKSLTSQHFMYSSFLILITLIIYCLSLFSIQGK